MVHAEEVDAASVLVAQPAVAEVESMITTVTVTTWIHHVSSSAILNAKRVGPIRRQASAVRETAEAPAEVCRVEAVKMLSQAPLTRRAVAARPISVLPTVLAVDLHHLAHLMVGPHLPQHQHQHRVVATVVCPTMASVVRHLVGSAEEPDAVVSPVVPTAAALAPLWIRIAPAITSLPLAFCKRASTAEIKNDIIRVYALTIPNIRNIVSVLRFACRGLRPKIEYGIHSTLTNSVWWGSACTVLVVKHWRRHHVATTKGGR